MERIGREVIKARGLTVDHEISNHRAHKSEEEARVLFRATERTEREIMDNLEANLSLKDGPFPRLPTMKFRHPNEHIYAFKKGWWFFPLFIFLPATRLRGNQKNSESF